MSRPLAWLLAATLALVALVLPSVTVAATQTSSHTSISITQYKASIKSLITLFIQANNQIVVLGTDLTRANYSRASKDGTRAVAGIKRAKSRLDHLSVPRSARQVEALMEKGFAKFLSGAQMMQHGAATKNLSLITKGTLTYSAGLSPLRQASAILRKLK